VSHRMVVSGEPSIVALAWRMLLARWRTAALNQRDSYYATVSYSTDPRAARSREAMLGAARQLLVREGPGAVTHQRVAQQAGVGRATVYRHWPRPDQLLLDAMGGTDLPLFKDPEAPVRPWLHRQLRQMADELAVPAVAAVALTLAQSAMWDPEIAHRHDESVKTIVERIHAAVQSAVASGELETDAGPSDLTAMLVGPIVYRTTMQRSVVSGDLIDRLINSIGTWCG
jgi:AcrR family transcriptional regulator